ncbi:MULTISPECIES: DUF397 domain-containing protein [Actinoalloteichus]|uniref:DUF397 family protein n=1 Tax=Actinoalloteichus fjordicus TaxID=1612552 RepID=A0AAC9LFS8_9PSEU|nr:MULTISPECIES: DUF397 domain-containing protein [Actinoalloteichus]APU16065.1 putative DUF397 family protein [Actinoalloteichus fjordicus]APU22130.1 putative DUF397 family protein [Actinoalloteichus sp. GBA129-24]
MTRPQQPTIWRKSSRSQNTTNCVEIGRTPGRVGIRDTKNRDGGTLIVGRADFSSFLRAVKADRLG